MKDAIRNCQDTLSEVLKLLSPRGGAEVEALDQALKSVEDLTNLHREERDLWRILLPVRQKLRDARPESDTSIRLIQRFREAGIPRSEFMTRMVTIDAAAREIWERQHDLQLLLECVERSPPAAVQSGFTGASGSSRNRERQFCA